VNGCEATDLREILRAERILATERALALIARTGAALDAAREAGLACPAVNPSRIQVMRDVRGREHVRVSGDAAPAGSELTEMIGYAPPEQLNDDLGERRDPVYSLACVLYECLAGEAPFERKSDVEAVFAHLHEPPPRLSSLRPDLPPALDAVFLTALAKDPRSRYRTCAELTAAAASALERSSRNRRALALASAFAALLAMALMRRSQL
jgi:serine/threonine-protein kinase